MTTIPRAAALNIASVAWTAHIVADNLRAGFKAAGIWPLSRTQMQGRLERYTTGGLPALYQVPEWIKARNHIRSTILTCPAEPPKRAPRRRVRVSGDVLKIAELQDIGNAERRKAKAARSAMASAKRGKKKRVSAGGGVAVALPALGSFVELLEMDRPPEVVSL